ncbi:DMT family transporter [Bacillus massiliigorillae]|uniref:DMT family transporter n=1 Tax=Bacillus massiliigorillae TaxID=1243664 RepID=UPI0003A0DD17|nr:SMR family transporter [Bacillus massiliigorillae]
MGWVLVLIAGALEVIWASSLKVVSTPMEWIILISIIAISFVLLIISYKRIPVAVAYSVFVGIGTIGTYIISVLSGQEFSLIQGVAVLGLLAGIIGLKMSTDDKPKNERSHS